MQKFRTVILFAAALIGLSTLTGCGEETFTLAQVSEKVTQAEAKARADEASKTDGKLSAAMRELKKVGEAVARQGGYSASANCNVMPAEVQSTKAAKDFPQNIGMMYKEACDREVVAMNAERDKMKATAAANARAAEQKRLAEAGKHKGKRHSTVARS
jgi:hypothetical protein